MVYSYVPSWALDSVDPVVEEEVVVVACENLPAWVDGSICRDRVDYRHAVGSSCCAEVMSRPTCSIPPTLMHFRVH